MKMTIIPQSLQPGDKVAIISPATVVKPEYIDGAAEFFAASGLRPVVMPFAKGPESGSYAASLSEREGDFRNAWADPEIRAVLCARGGYGCNHFINSFSQEFLRENAKWLIGFSDVSALHAMLFNAGVASIHAPMAKHLSTLPPDNYCTRALMEILTHGVEQEYFAPPHPYNRTGVAEGRLAGGNLAVLNGLAATPYDIFAAAETEDIILFIEDISEAIYAVERMLIRLALAGQLGKLKGLIVGSFTEYRPDRNHPDMETMINSLFSRLPQQMVPPVVAYGFPVGHTDDNLPLVEGSRATLSVSEEGTILSTAR